LAAAGTGAISAPFLTIGRIVSIKEKNYTLQIELAVPQKSGDQELLALARSISHGYGLPVKKVEIFVRNEENLKICRLYYLEDKDGEFYQFSCK
jgi:hypothetical protein